MNIAIYQGKGGVSKSTTANIVADNIENSLLLEIDRVNETQSDIKGNYQVQQINFNHINEESFLQYENLLLDTTINKIIDVGASKIDIFHKCMLESGLYANIDLLIIPCIDGGYDEFNTALDVLSSLKGIIPSSKILLSFGKWNEYEYSSSIFEQYDTWYKNKELLKKEFGIDLNDEDNYITFKDSRAVKYSRTSGISVKTLADMDLEGVSKKQLSEQDSSKRLEHTKLRSLIVQARNFQSQYVNKAMEKINKKLNVNIKKGDK